MTEPIVHQYVTSAWTLNFSYVAMCPETRKGFVVDPTGESDIILKAIKSLRAQILYLINTHTHPDHVEAISAVKEATGAAAMCHSGGLYPEYFDEIWEGEQKTLKVGNLEVKMIHTPGHSKDSVCILCGEALFTGDTLFIGYVGRTDLPGSSSREMFKSLSKIRELPDNLIVYPGHNYGEAPFRLLGEEKQLSPFLRARTFEELGYLLGSQE